MVWALLTLPEEVKSEKAQPVNGCSVGNVLLEYLDAKKVSGVVLIKG